MKGMSRLLRTSKTEVKVPLWKCDSREGLRLNSDLDATPLDLSFCTCEMRKALDPASQSCEDQMMQAKAHKTVLGTW